MKRKVFIKSLLGFAGLGLFSGVYAWQFEPFWLQFVKKKMTIPNLPQSLKGKTLMQISDIHVGNKFDWNYIIDSFQKAKLYNPDFVVYTGDFVTYEDENQFTQLETVLKSAVKGKIATVAILGNHDYGHGWSNSVVANSIVELLQKAGIQVLRNEEAEFDNLTIIGFDDFWGTNFNPEKAMKNYNSSKANLVMCHNPDVCDLDIWKGYKGWILSGHTHGGQVKPPFLNPPMLPVKNKKYSAGEIDLNDGRTLYINRALGHLWQVRFNVRPEITIFELA